MKAKNSRDQCSVGRNMNFSVQDDIINAIAYNVAINEVRDQMVLQKF